MMWRVEELAEAVAGLGLGQRNIGLGLWKECVMRAES